MTSRPAWQHGKKVIRYGKKIVQKGNHYDVETCAAKKKKKPSPEEEKRQQPQRGVVKEGESCTVRRGGACPPTVEKRGFPQGDDRETTP